MKENEELYEIASKLKSYEQQILSKEISLVTAKREVAKINKKMSEIKTDLEKEIIGNIQYKNETQRKNALNEELAENNEFTELNSRLEKISNSVEDIGFEIEKNKIEARYLKRILDIELHGTVTQGASFSPVK